MIVEHLIGPAVTMIGVIIGLAVAWGRLGSRLQSIENSVESISDTCTQYRTNCQARNHGDLTRLGQAVEDLIRREEDKWNELDRLLSNMDKFMGRVEQYMIMKNGGDINAGKTPPGWGTMR